MERRTMGTPHNVSCVDERGFVTPPIKYAHNFSQKFGVLRLIYVPSCSNNLSGRFNWALSSPWCRTIYAAHRVQDFFKREYS